MPKINRFTKIKKHVFSCVNFIFFLEYHTSISPNPLAYFNVFEINFIIIVIIIIIKLNIEILFSNQSLILVKTKKIMHAWSKIDTSTAFLFFTFALLVQTLFYRTQTNSRFPNKNYRYQI
jgi:hypothetical protein